MPTTKDKSLRSKAVNIKGKAYVLVADRVSFFNEMYENGMIETEILSDVESERVVIKAKVTPNVGNPARCFIGHSQAEKSSTGVNATAALENAETSAVGRALAMMGIGVIESIASVDEIHKAKGTPVSAPALGRPPANAFAPTKVVQAQAKIPCDNVSCKGVAKALGELCWPCYKSQKEGAIIKFRRSEGAVPDEEMPLTENGAPKF